MSRPRLKPERMRSAEALRARLVAWLIAKGAEKRTEHEHNDVLGGVIGGDWRILTRVGWLVVHTPCDEPYIHPVSRPGERMRRAALLSIYTRFEDWPAGKLPGDANPYSGKWNFDCYESEDELFEHFTTRAEALL